MDQLELPRELNKVVSFRLWAISTGISRQTIARALKDGSSPYPATVIALNRAANDFCDRIAALRLAEKGTTTNG